MKEISRAKKQKRERVMQNKRAGESAESEEMHLQGERGQGTTGTYEQ